MDGLRVESRSEMLPSEFGRSVSLHRQVVLNGTSGRPSASFGSTRAT